MADNLLDLSNYLKSKLTKNHKFTKTERFALEQFDKKLDDIIADLSAMQLPNEALSGSLKDRLAYRKEFDKKRLAAALAMLNDFKQMVESELEKDSELKEKILKKLAKPINHLDFILNNHDGQIALIRYFLPDLNETFLIAKIFALDFIPFNQAYDPFFGSSDGNCWGHTLHWAEMIASKSMDHRMITDSKILQDQKRNCTIQDVISNRVQFYKISQMEYVDAIWDVVNRLQPDDIFTLDFKEPNKIFGFHATGIRLYGKSGIEFMDSNEGIFRFASKHDFVNFYALYLMGLNNTKQTKIKYLTVFRLPYKNDPFVNFEEPKTPLCSPEDKLTAISTYRSKQVLRKYRSVVEDHILDLKQSELEQTTDKNNLLNRLIETIIGETTSSSLLFFKENPKKKEKYLHIHCELKKISEELGEEKNTHPQEKACLLFALIAPTLATVPGLKEKIEKWLNLQMIDRELLTYYQKRETVPVSLNAEKNDLTEQVKSKEKKVIEFD